MSLRAFTAPAGPNDSEGDTGLGQVSAPLTLHTPRVRVYPSARSLTGIESIQMEGAGVEN